MKVYEPANIRNVVLVGHQSSGKTMVAEAMLFQSGAITRVGSINDGSTVSDYHESEHQREMSVFASLLHVEWEGSKINVVDTPGYPDFVGEVTASLTVTDTALFVLNAADPVQVGTEVTWGYVEKMGMPAAFLVNQVDKSGIEIDAVIEQLQERFGRAATPLQFPAGDGTRAVVDVLLMKQLTFGEGKTAPTVGEIDAALRERAEAARTYLVENIAENDESLMELYLEKGELNEEEVHRGLRSAIQQRLIFPVLVSSATHNVGIQRVLTVLRQCFPSAAEAACCTTEGGDDIACDKDAEPVAFVYRTMSEQHVGEYSFLKVASGTLEAGMDLENAQTGASERLGGLFVLNGRNRDAVPKMCAGDLGATVKLKDTHTNNTLRQKGSSVVVAPIQFPAPRYTASLHAVNAGEEDKLSAGLHKLVAEDPSLKIIHDSDLNQLLLAGLGEMQLEIARFRLKFRFGVEVELSIPLVSYRETVQKSARASYRHKKQTGGAGQFADISMLIEPLHGEYQAPADIKVRNTSTVETSWGAKLEMIDAIVSGVIDMRRFASAIQKGIVEAMGSGPIAGYPCGDVRVVVYDGKMHSVDSNEAAFKTAARGCFRKAFEDASPVLLEPIFDIEVITPDEYTGDVMGDLNTRRARIQGMESEGASQKILAQAPELELLRYSTQLRSLTQGRGIHSATFRAYEPMPKHVQDKVVAETKRKKADED